MQGDNGRENRALAWPQIGVRGRQAAGKSGVGHGVQSRERAEAVSNAGAILEASQAIVSSARNRCSGGNRNPPAVRSSRP